MAGGQRSSDPVRSTSNINRVFIDNLPGPGSVNLKGQFDGEKASSVIVPKAFSFGMSREHYKKVYIKEAVQVDPVVPGPGRYALPTSIGQDGHITMKGRNEKEKSQSKPYFSNLIVISIEIGIYPWTWGI